MEKDNGAYFKTRNRQLPITYARVFDSFTVDLIHIAWKTTSIAPHDLENAADPPEMVVSREKDG
jgi:hypothetical protein